MTRAAVTVTRTPGARYPYRATCSCGWLSWGYLTEQAAQGMADHHAASHP